jgi:hypothetical protein
LRVHRGRAELGPYRWATLLQQVSDHADIVPHHADLGTDLAVAVAKPNQPTLAGENLDGKLTAVLARHDALDGLQEDQAGASAGTRKKALTMMFNSNFTEQSFSEIKGML